MYDLDLVLRKITLEDCAPISQAFKAQGWNKPQKQYEHYHQLQESGIRDVIIADYQAEFAGYLTIMWESNYGPFKAAGIPEIVDFNVLKKFQRRGIGSALMDEAETRVKKRSPICGIGVGMLKSYGAAQILYVQRGYIPDGSGLYNDDQALDYGDTVIMGDGVVLHLTKTL
ncbi:MAG: GNAT family N-acetyltransferase [Bacteroidota bacterium]